MTQQEAPQRGLRLSVLTGEFHSPNGGMSARVKQVTLVGEGVAPVFPVTDEAPAVVLVTRYYGGQVLRNVEPAVGPDAGNVGWMAGGAYVATSDSRVRDLIGFYGALAFHDRQETPEQYRALSI